MGHLRKNKMQCLTQTTHEDVLVREELCQLVEFTLQLECELESVVQSQGLQ